MNLTTRTLAFLALAAALLGATGCVQAPTGGTSGTSIYVYDNASESVLVWNDVNTLYAAPTAPPAADVTLTAGNISNMAPVGWGGLAADPTTNCLYIVAATGGAVTRISQLSTQTGAVTNSYDIATFTLSDTNTAFSNSTFGQACVDSTANTLYVTETGASRTTSRVWVIPSASSLLSGSTVTDTGSTIPVINNDYGYSGVAVGQSHLVYGYFPNGNTLYSNILQNTPLDGGRIRQGTTSGWYSQYLTTDVLVGPLTELSDATTLYGTLGYDTVNNILYCARGGNATPASGTTVLPAVVAFTPGQFTTSNFNVAPTSTPTFSDTVATLPNLRFITHAGLKDWMAGADTTSSTGGSASATNLIHLWQSPSAGGASVEVTLPSGVAVAAIALDGSN